MNLQTKKRYAIWFEGASGDMFEPHYIEIQKDMGDGWYEIQYFDHYADPTSPLIKDPHSQVSGPTYINMNQIVKLIDMT